MGVIERPCPSLFPYHIPWNGWTETDFRTPYEPVAAHFSGSPTSGAVPLTVTFVNTSTGASVFLWDFGDGFTSTLENPVHVYTVTGFFTCLVDRV